LSQRCCIRNLLHFSVAQFTVVNFTVKKWLPNLPLPNFPVAQFYVAQFTVAQFSANHFTVAQFTAIRDIRTDGFVTAISLSALAAVLYAVRLQQECTLRVRS